MSRITNAYSNGDNPPEDDEQPSWYDALQANKFVPVVRIPYRRFDPATNTWRNAYTDFHIIADDIEDADDIEAKMERGEELDDDGYLCVLQDYENFGAIMEHREPRQLVDADDYFNNHSNNKGTS